METQKIEALIHKIERLSEILEASTARQKLTSQEIKNLNDKVSVTIKTVNSILDYHIVSAIKIGNKMN